MEIYGVDVDSNITALVVRDAILRCFIEAHIEDAKKQGLDNLEDAEKLCIQKVHEAFQQTGGDFDNPTKAALLKAVGFLAEFSRSFRYPNIIEKHKTQIMQLLSLIPGDPLIMP